MKKIKSKILIVGAGPAGATLSLFLSKYQIQHVLVDKATFPRDKICGDGLTLEVMYILKKIHPDLYNEFINSPELFHPANGWKMYSEGGGQFAINFEKDELPCAAYYTSRRTVFDTWLFNHTASPYCESYLDCGIDQVERNGNLIIAKGKFHGEEIEFEADIIIGADGERSIVKKHLHPDGIAKAHKHNVAGIRAYYKNVTGCSSYQELELLYLKELLPGYFWIFPMADGTVNVGLGMLTSDVSKNKINLKKIFFNAIENHPQLKDRFKNAEMDGKLGGWGIPLSSKKETLYGDQYMILGDAGYLAEPATGKGIGIAMLSAEIAADVIAKNIQSSNFSAEFTKEYQTTIERRHRKEWNYLYYFQTLCRYRIFTEFFTRAYNLPFSRKLFRNAFHKTFNKYLN